MPTPAPYSRTDTPEQDAYITLLALINTSFVKADIRTRDKVPNIDGTIEIVDKKGVPLGKLEVQLKKMEDGADRYSCPSQLVAYSRVSSAPVILICADPSCDKAYWHHITPSMPEYKPGQDWFTVYFDEDADGIDSREVYIQKWLEITKEYQERIAQYPILKKEAIDSITLPTLSAEDKVFFTKFIDTVNDLLNRDFVSVKERAFPGVWKLGVGILTATTELVRYQIYRIPFSEPGQPLVCPVDESSFDLETSKRHANSNHRVPRNLLGSAETQGLEFVYKYVSELANEKAFPLYGKGLAVEALYAFLDKYADCLDLPFGQNSYTVSDISHGLNDHLFGICAAIVQTLPTVGDPIVTMDIGSVSAFIKGHHITPVKLADTSARIVLTGKDVNMQSVFDAVRYLTSQKIGSIGRIYTPRKKRDFHKNWRWTGFSKEEEAQYVSDIVQLSFQDYREFVDGNHFAFPRSAYLDKETAFIYEYEVDDSVYPWYSPHLSIYRIKDSHGKLPKLTVKAVAKSGEHLRKPEGRVITLDGEEYQLAYISEGNGGHLYSDTPISTLVYGMLQEDLEKHYGIKHLRHHY